MGGEGGVFTFIMKNVVWEGPFGIGGFLFQNIDVIYRNRVLLQKLASRESWEQVAAKASFLLEQLLQENTAFVAINL